MINLLEKLFEIVKSKPYWLDRQGNLISLSTKYHIDDLISRGGSVEGSQDDIGNIRVRIFPESSINVDIGNWITVSQLKKLLKLSKEYKEFYYDIIGPSRQKSDSGEGYKNMWDSLRRFDWLKEGEIKESTIDFPQLSLEPAIWEKVGDTYKIKPDTKKIILDTLGKYTKIRLDAIADSIHITGSIGTNQYTDNADIDVHLVVDESRLNNALDIQKDVFKFFRLDENIVHVDRHPIEVFLQFNPRQELLAEAVYDLQKDTWIVGPKIVSEDYDPYTDFSDVMSTVKELAEEADEQLGELKRDMVDYDTINSAIGNLSAGAQQKLVIKLKDKLQEMEDDIESLKDTKLDWITLRREASLPVSEEEALEDVEMAKKWREANAIFKYLSRYKYIKVISKLEQMLSDKKLEPEELNLIRQMMGVEK